MENIGVKKLSNLLFDHTIHEFTMLVEIQPFPPYIHINLIKDHFPKSKPAVNTQTRDGLASGLGTEDDGTGQATCRTPAHPSIADWRES